MSGLDPEFGIKMMEIKVAENYAQLNLQRRNKRSQNLARPKLTRIVKIRDNFM